MSRMSKPAMLGLSDDFILETGMAAVLRKRKHEAETIMQGSIGKELWDEIDGAFLIMPEDGWVKNFIKHVQTEYHWTLEHANNFIAWCEYPHPSALRDVGGLDMFQYMKNQAETFYQSEKRPLVDGFTMKCNDCSFEQFIPHFEKQRAIEIARDAGWLIRGTGEFGPDSCPQCKYALELLVERKIRGDGGYA